MSASFTFNTEWSDIIGKYDAETQLSVYQAITSYASSGHIPEMTPVAGAMFAFIRLEIDKERARKEAIAQKRSAAGRRSAAARRKPVSKPVPAPEQVDDEDEVEIIDEDDIIVEDKPKRKKRSAFVRPTLEQVQEYIEHKGYSVDAEAFVAYYESNGWRVGSSKMSSWQSAVFTWHKRNTNPQNNQHYGTNTFNRPLTPEEAKAKRDREFAEHIYQQLYNPEPEFDIDKYY